MYRITRIEPGLTLATARLPYMASVCVGIWVGVGGRYESAQLCGVSHFIEHLLFKGTRKRSARQISEQVEGMGGDLNAFTCEENTCIFAKAHHEHLPDLFEIMMDMFHSSRFQAEEIEKEREVIKEELSMYLDQPQQHVQELMNETLWPDHPLGRSVTGTEESVSRLSRSEIVQYQQTHYVLGNILITMAGNLDHAEIRQLLAPYGRFFRTGARSVFLPAPSQQDKPRIRLFTKPTEQTQLALGIRTCSRHDERRFALRLLNTMLGENMSSRLFQIVREEHGLAYSIGSSLGLFDDVGSLAVAAGLDSTNLGSALKLIIQELLKLAATPPSAAELRRAREYLIGQLELSLESTSNHMMWIGEQIMGYGKILHPSEIKQRLAEVRPSEVRAVAREFFRPERISLALVSPLKSLKGITELLHW